MESQQGELKVFQEGQKLKEEKLNTKLDSFDFTRKFARILESLLEFEKQLKSQNKAIESQRVDFLAFKDQQLNKEEELNAKMETQNKGIKSSNQITQIIIVVATIFIAMLILLF